jgi:hypothetical protein
MLRRVPVKKLSMQSTWQPRSSSLSARCDPRKPAPPEMRTRRSRCIPPQATQLLCPRGLGLKVAISGLARNSGCQQILGRGSEYGRPSGTCRSANAKATTLSVCSSGVVLTAIFGGAEDAPSNRRTHNSGRDWIAEESLSVIFPDQGLGGAWRLLPNANNPSWDDAHLASAWIDELRAAPGVRHQQVAGVCIRAACRRTSFWTAPG